MNQLGPVWFQKTGVTGLWRSWQYAKQEMARAYPRTGEEKWQRGGIYKRHSGGKLGYQGSKGRGDGANGVVIKKDQGTWEEEQI